MNDEPAATSPQPGARPATGMTVEQRRALGAELDRLLGQQLARVRRRYLWHGVAVTLLLPAAAILVAFLLDHFLRLPAPIRIFHALLIAGALVFAAWRFLHYPLARRFLPFDVAVAIERCFPDLHERLVSAIQLKGALGAGDAEDLRNQSPAMIERLLADTAERARALPLGEMFDDRRSRRTWTAAAAAVVLLFAGALSGPETAAAFLWRHLGLDVSYPRATNLVVELPPAGPDLQREDSPGRVDLVMPAGAALHVSVLAQGTVPDEVFLDIETSSGDQRTVAASPRAGGRFRHVLRNVTGTFSFRARGGDDDRGDKVVHVRTIHPPLVAQIKAELRPPAYTGRQITVQQGGAVEALQGTVVSLSVACTADVEQATLLFLESGRRIPLTATTVTDDSGSLVVQVGEFVVDASDRYQIDLVGDSGLSNPNPGTYPVTALQDYAPVGRWLQPEDESSTLRLPTGLLCVRGFLHDDFGLHSGTLTVDAGAGRTTTRTLLPATEGDQRPVEVVFAELVPIETLLGEQRSADGLSLQIDLTDNRAPEPNATQLPRRQVQIVDQAQLAAAVGRHFRSLREQAEQALDLQLDRKIRLEELLTGGVFQGVAAAQVMTAVEIGQGRVQGHADRLHLGMMRAFDLHLWNRQEQSPNATAVEELYLAWHREHGTPVSFQPEFYRLLRERRSQGTLGAMEQVLDPILAMVTLADRLATAEAPPPLRLLAEAQVGRNAADVEKKLRATLEAQVRIVATLGDLLDRLDQWNDYQDLVQEARALREKQRDVRNRTEELRGKR